MKEWLPYKNKEEIKCKLIYEAKKDGDSAKNFHALCDNKGPTLTFISTSDNKKIGGFLSKSFDGNKGSITDKNAFLFSLNHNEKYPSLNYGIIQINDDFLKSEKNYYHPYTCRYDFGKRNINQNFYFTVLDLEIYQILNVEDL